MLFNAPIVNINFKVWYLPTPKNLASGYVHNAAHTRLNPFFNNLANIHWNKRMVRVVPVVVDKPSKIVRRCIFNLYYFTGKKTANKPITYF
jgi:hypothetical protein